MIALLLGFAMLCFGLAVAAPTAAHAADGRTVSGTIIFPTSAPSNVRQTLDWSDPDSTRAGVYLTLYKDQSGTAEGWELGKDSNVSYNPSTGGWSITGVPNGSYRLTISVILPNNGSAKGTSKVLTVNNANVAAGTTSIAESGRLRASFALCGWKSGDDVAHYAQNVSTGKVTRLESAQSGWVEPSTECPPEVSYGNYNLAEGIPAGDYIAYTVWNGGTSYYTGVGTRTASNRADALVFPVKNWEGTWLQTLVHPRIVAGSPTISGTAQVGQTLTANAGTWGPAPVTLAYQWLRDGTAISGATGKTYVPAAADQGKKISVRVTGSKTGYQTVSKTSAQTAAVAAKPADPGPTTSFFEDVPKTHQFYVEITWMGTTGLSTGVKTATGRAFQPEEGVSREAMAAFLYRLEGATAKGPKTSPFVDVQPGDQFYDEIAWMRSEGISVGVNTPSGKAYQPKATVSRKAMAAFLYRLEH
ncbi:MAG: S-layer homology domain-containing protein [Leucobacter sp.]